MPQTLADVLHFFLPEIGEGHASASLDERPGAEHAAGAGAEDARVDRRPARAWPILGAPLGSRDVVRSAFVWNLAIELARLGRGAALLAPAEPDASALWPDPGRGPLGVEVILAAASEPAALARAAQDLATLRAVESPEAEGVLLVRVPTGALEKPADVAPLLSHVLLFATPDARDLLDAFALARRVVGAVPDAVLGVIVHGVRSLEEARESFERLARAVERHLDRPLLSWGLVAGDLHVHRSILHRRAVSLTQPQSPTARSLSAAAGLIAHDLGEIDDG